MEPRRDSDFDQIFLHPTTSNRSRGGDSIALSSRNNAAYRRLSSAEEPYLHSYEAHGSSNPATPPTYRDAASRGFGLGIGQPGNGPVSGMGEESDLGYHPSHHSRHFSESSLLRESADTSPDFTTAYHRPSPSFNSSFQSYGSDSNTVRIVEPENGQEYGTLSI